MFIYKSAIKLVLFLMLFGAGAASAQKPAALFTVVPLGVKGGLDESNLSAYLVAAANTNNFICLDAGTIHAGLEKAIQQHVFQGAANAVLKKVIKGYLISHAHLDHVAGLVLNSPDDTAKNIYALPFVINTLKRHYFTWQSWANFTNEGDSPRLNKYRYKYLAEDSSTEIANTHLRVRAFELSHAAPGKSTAFVVQNNTNYLLYLGDTGPDAVEGSDKLQQLWQTVAPLVKNKSLKALLIEVSYPNEQPDKLLFGHLTPRWLMKEMDSLSSLVGIECLKNFPVVITHMKPTGTNEQKIKKQLAIENKLGLKLIFPQQGVLLNF